MYSICSLQHTKDGYFQKSDINLNKVSFYNHDLDFSKEMHSLKADIALITNFLGKKRILHGRKQSLNCYFDKIQRALTVTRGRNA